MALVPKSETADRPRDVPYLTYFFGGRYFFSTEATTT
jgi:hypothetical protein